MAAFRILTRKFPLLAVPYIGMSYIQVARSITASGAALDAADFYADEHHLGGHGGQVVRRVDGGAIPACTVVYSSGWAHDAIPLDLVGAGFEIARPAIV